MDPGERNTQKMFSETAWSMWRHLVAQSPIIFHGRFARRIKWRACDVEEANEGLENELWLRWSNGKVGKLAVTWLKWRKGWRMSCDVGEVTERLENEQSYITAHSPTLLLLLLRHRLFTYVTWWAAHAVNPPIPPSPQRLLHSFISLFYSTAEEGHSVWLKNFPPFTNYFLWIQLST